MTKKQKSKSYVNRTAKECDYDIFMKKMEKRNFYEFLVGLIVVIALLIFTFYFIFGVIGK
ncbi:MAG: hypothetical protein FJX70_07595 [Alphaproteobacteria bacterium]|nr:hypothetical protein [Alphaproteobacteria bacterium]